jgi:hypothetical protein
MNGRTVQPKTAIPAQTLTLVRHGMLQRKCACGGAPGIDGKCAECRKKRLALQNRSPNQSGPSTVPPIVHDVLRSPGQPLDPGTRAFMEPRFGHDFSQVRVHADAQAVESTWAVNALAYTVGRDVVFGTGKYEPATMEGRRLLAHELTHVVQQSSGASSLPITYSLVEGTADPLEHEADNKSEQILSKHQSEQNNPILSSLSVAGLLQKKPPPSGQKPATVKQPSVTKTLTIVSWIRPEGLPDFSKSTVLFGSRARVPLTALEMILKCTANQRPPRTLGATEVEAFQKTKEYRAIQRYTLTIGTSETSPGEALQIPGFTAPSKCGCKDVPPCSYLPGEMSPLNYSKFKPNSFEALMKFRVSAAEEEAAIKERPLFFRMTGSLGLEKLHRVPWVWTKSTGNIQDNGKLAWSVSASAFPTHTIYVDGQQVAEIPQQNASVLLGPHVRTTDKPRQTIEEEKAQAETPLSAQEETVRPGGSDSGNN